MGHQFEELSSRILAAAVDVHKALGPGFLESIYQKAMEVALEHRGVPHQRQKEVCVFFEEVAVGLQRLDLVVGAQIDSASSRQYPVRALQRLDLVVGAQIILELKAVKALEDIHFAQLRSYLRATGLRVGLLLNFNAPTLVVKRVVLWRTLRCLLRAFVLSYFRDSF
jgi:hypothetical protein